MAPACSPNGSLMLTRIQHVTVALVAAAVFLFCAGDAPVASGAVPKAVGSQARPVRIMELGDSITAGIAAGGFPDPQSGYRSKLIDLLEQHSYDFTMVGSRTDFSGTLAYPQHEGWPGYVLRSFPSAPAGQLYGPVIHDAIVGYHPDIVLLMAGTNDLLRYRLGDPGYTLPNILQSLDLVLDEIFTLDPRVTVVVAGVVDSPKVPECAVLEFDDGESPCGDSPVSVASLVKFYQSRGFDIVMADGMDRAVPRSSAYFPDGIHPSGRDGYDRVAGVWYQALLELLRKPGSPAISRTANLARH
jgi:lysophospholipase L1-like esterase